MGSALIEMGQLRAVITPGNDPAHKSHFHVSAMMPIDAELPDFNVDVTEILSLAR